MLRDLQRDKKDTEFEEVSLEDTNSRPNKLRKTGANIVDILFWPFQRIKSHKVASAVTSIALLSAYGHIYVGYEANRGAQIMHDAAIPTGHDAGEEAVKTAANYLSNKKTRQEMAQALATGFSELPAEAKSELFNALFSSGLRDFITNPHALHDIASPPTTTAVDHKISGAVIAQLPPLKP